MFSFLFILTCRSVVIHGKMAARLPMFSPAGAEPQLAGSGACHVVGMSYSGVTWVGGQRTRDWQKQKQQGASNNKRAVGSSSEGDKHDIRAILSQEAPGAGGLHNY